MATVALVDVMFPEGHLGPSASSLRVPDYIDEWVSAPYPAQQKVRPVILDGLDALDAESVKRFKRPFAKLKPAQQSAICDDFAILPKPGLSFKNWRSFSKHSAS
jgi:hypothetical protein